MLNIIEKLTATTDLNIQAGKILMKLQNSLFKKNITSQIKRAFKKELRGESKHRGCMKQMKGKKISENV